VIGTLIVTHGQLAKELLAAAEVISGGLTGFAAVALDWDDGLEEARKKIRLGLEQVPRSEGVIILTGMFGDTPSKAAIELAEPGKVEVMSGVNLPMVVRLACLERSGRTLSETVRWLEIKGRRSIRRASQAFAVTATPVPQAPAKTPDRADD